MIDSAVCRHAKVIADEERFPNSPIKRTVFGIQFSQDSEILFTSYVILPTDHAECETVAPGCTASHSAAVCPAAIRQHSTAPDAPCLLAALIATQCYPSGSAPRCHIPGNGGGHHVDRDTESSGGRVPWNPLCPTAGGRSQVPSGRPCQCFGRVGRCQSLWSTVCFQCICTARRLIVRQLPRQTVVADPRG